MKSNGVLTLSNEFEKRCCFTGYRPGKFPFPLQRGDRDYQKMENSLVETVFSMPSEECYTFFSGMAMGFDMIAAEAVLLLKACNPAVRLVCALPFSGQGEGFFGQWHSRYQHIIENADEVISLSDRYYSGCYFRRNTFMVDHCDFVITWYDGKRGGTMQTLNYAEKSGRRIINLNSGFQKYGGGWN